MKQPERITKTHIYFWGSFYSQWAKYDMIDNSLQQKFSSCEQYMMYHKAILFKDKESAQKILDTNDVKKQKELGRKVKNFNESEWNKHKFDIIVKGNLLKFSQNEEIKAELISSGDKILVEASPYDKIYGVGLKWNNDLILDERNWKGENLLGKALMQVREILKKEKNPKREKLKEAIKNIPKEKLGTEDILSEDLAKKIDSFSSIEMNDRIINVFLEKNLYKNKEEVISKALKLLVKEQIKNEQSENKQKFNDETYLLQLNNKFKKDVIYCPKCGKIHIDEGEWSKRLHHKHLCLHCKHVWELDEYIFGISLEDKEILMNLEKGLDDVKKGKGITTDELKDKIKNKSKLFTEIKGSILDAKEDIIAQGCNCSGASGAGIAKYIAQEYPESDKRYKELCKTKKFHLGTVMFHKEKGKTQAFCGTQQYYGKYLKMDKDSIEKRYDAIEECLMKIYNKAKAENLSVALPRIGCGRARADWDRVKGIIQKVFYDHPVTIYWIPDRYSKK